MLLACLLALITLLQMHLCLALLSDAYGKRKIKRQIENALSLNEVADFDDIREPEDSSDLRNNFVILSGFATTFLPNIRKRERSDDSDVIILHSPEFQERTLKASASQSDSSTIGIVDKLQNLELMQKSSQQPVLEQPYYQDNSKYEYRKNMLPFKNKEKTPLKRLYVRPRPLKVAPMQQEDCHYNEKQLSIKHRHKVHNAPRDKNIKRSRLFKKSKLVTDKCAANNLLRNLSAAHLKSSREIKKFKKAEFLKRIRKRFIFFKSASKKPARKVTMLDLNDKDTNSTSTLKKISVTAISSTMSNKDKPGDLADEGILKLLDSSSIKPLITIEDDTNIPDLTMVNYSPSSELCNVASYSEEPSNIINSKIKAYARRICLAHEKSSMRSLETSYDGIEINTEVPFSSANTELDFSYSATSVTDSKIDKLLTGKTFGNNMLAPPYSGSNEKRFLGGVNGNRKSCKRFNKYKYRISKAKYLKHLDNSVKKSRRCLESSCGNVGLSTNFPFLTSIAILDCNYGVTPITDCRVNEYLAGRTCCGGIQAPPCFGCSGKKFDNGANGDRKSYKRSNKLKKFVLNGKQTKHLDDSVKISRSCLVNSCDSDVMCTDFPFLQNIIDLDCRYGVTPILDGIVDEYLGSNQISMHTIPPRSSGDNNESKTYLDKLFKRLNIVPNKHVDSENINFGNMYATNDDSITSRNNFNADFQKNIVKDVSFVATTPTSKDQSEDRLFKFLNLHQGQELSVVNGKGLEFTSPNSGNSDNNAFKDHDNEKYILRFTVNPVIPVLLKKRSIAKNKKAMLTKKNADDRVCAHFIKEATIAIDGAEQLEKLYGSRLKSLKATTKCKTHATTVAKKCKRNKEHLERKLYFNQEATFYLRKRNLPVHNLLNTWSSSLLEITTSIHEASTRDLKREDEVIESPKIPSERLHRNMLATEFDQVDKKISS